MSFVSRMIVMCKSTTPPSDFIHTSAEYHLVAGAINGINICELYTVYNKVFPFFETKKKQKFYFIILFYCQVSTHTNNL